MNYIDKLKKDTDNSPDITYRKIIINKQSLTIIYSNSLTSSNQISDFVIRSLKNIKSKYFSLQNI